MSHHETTGLLDGLVTDAAVGPAPTQALLRAGRRRVRRTRTAVVGAVAVTAAVAVGGVAVLGRGAPDRGTQEPSAAAPAQISAMVYVIQRGRLVPRYTGVPDTGDPGLDAVRALLRTPSTDNQVNGFALRTEGPDPVTDVESVTYADGLVTVDLTADVWDPNPLSDLTDPPDGRLVTQQLVWTVNGALGTDAEVLVTVDGEPARGIWLHPLDGPVTLASDLADLVAPSGLNMVHGRWNGRPTLASCGVVDTGPRPSELTVAEQTGYDCLEKARDTGEGAELQVDQLTTEGDPVSSWYRVTPEGRLEVYADATADAFGSGRWDYASCAAADLRRGC